MGYRISYENGWEKTQLQTRERNRKSVIIKWSAFVAAVAFILAFVYSYRFRQFFLPGNKTVTETAIAELVESVRDGEELGEAVTTFCRQIIANGAQ